MCMKYVLHFALDVLLHFLHFLQSNPYNKFACQCPFFLAFKANFFFQMQWEIFNPYQNY